MRRIHVQRGLRTICATIAVCFAVLAAAETTALPHGVLSAPGGRYVFGQISEYARHQYMLDTLTGRLWQVVCAKREEAGEKKCTLNVLEPIPYLDEANNLIPAPQSAVKK